MASESEAVVEELENVAKVFSEYAELQFRDKKTEVIVKSPIEINLRDGFTIGKLRILKKMMMKDYDMLLDFCVCKSIGCNYKCKNWDTGVPDFIRNVTIFCFGTPICVEYLKIRGMIVKNETKKNV